LVFLIIFLLIEAATGTVALNFTSEHPIHAATLGEKRGPVKDNRTTLYANGLKQNVTEEAIGNGLINANELDFLLQP